MRKGSIDICKSKSICKNRLIWKSRLTGQLSESQLDEEIVSKGVLMSVRAGLDISCTDAERQ